MDIDNGISALLGEVKGEMEKHKVPLILGGNLEGDLVIKDITEVGGLLIAGSSSSGKSVFLSCLITTLITTKSPNEVKFVLIDPKRDSFDLYKDIEHLYAPVIHDTENSYKILTKISEEIEERKRSKYKEPNIVILIDEASDLLLSKNKNFDSLLNSITEHGKEVGVYLVLSTSISNHKVLTKSLQKNISARIAFAVATKEDSIVILGEEGAEKLLGNGDMLYKDPITTDPVRIQVPFLTTEGIKEMFGSKLSQITCIIKHAKKR